LRQPLADSSGEIARHLARPDERPGHAPPSQRRRYGPILRERGPGGRPLPLLDPFLGSVDQQTCASTVPAPACPGLGWNPGSVLTTTIWTVSPENCGPNFVILLDTITPMSAGSGPLGGGVLSPGSAPHPVPQLGVDCVSANPLKLGGAPPPLRE